MATTKTPSTNPSTISGNPDVAIKIPAPSAPLEPLTPPSRARSPLPSRTEDGIPIPSSGRSNDYYHIPGYDSQRREFTAPNSWQAFQTPSSWGGTSVLFNDDAVSVYGADDRSDTGTDAGSVAGLSYARKRRLLRQMSRGSVSASVSRQGLHSVKERWTKKLEDFREYEAGIFKSLVWLKAGIGAALASCLALLPFVPETLAQYGCVAVLGVGMSLESNVGLTLQKGYNLMLGSALAGLCALIVSFIEPHTGNFHMFYIITCVFLGGFLPRCISLPKVIKTRWAQTTTFYVSIFHGLILNKQIKMVNPYQFLLNCLCYSTGFLLALFLTLCVKPDYAGDSLLVLLVSDFHTTGVVLERIVEDYRGGVVLTKIQELLSGVVTEDHIHHDLQYIIKSTDEVEKLMGAVKWEPSHGKFCKGYPWDLYPTLLAMLLQVLYDLISLDSALRAEIQAPLDIRVLFAEDMETVARECSMLFHKVGDALFEHKKIDYHSNVQRAQLATVNLRTKLNRHSAAVLSRDRPPPPSRAMTRNQSVQSIQELYEEQSEPTISPVPTPPPSPKDANRDRVIEQDMETAQRLNIGEDDWRARLFTRRQSISEHWEETQQQISSLSFIKFASILIELMGKVTGLVNMVDQISEKAHFSEVTS
ncbi:unnamed protein product [Calypogeia fissa]